MQINKEDIRHGIHALGIEGLPVCIHSSLRSFGWVAGGAEMVLQAFLEEGCTVLVPTFSWSAYAISPPLLPDFRPARNGTDYDAAQTLLPGADRIYWPDSIEINREEMGAIPAAVLAMPGRVRGDHPLSSFAAVGPLARDLVSPQRPLNFCGPLMALADAGGWVILMGVGLTRLTLLHCAERQTGRALFRRWANGADGQPITVEVGGCSSGFEKFSPVLEPIERRVKVGNSLWRGYPAQQTLTLGAEAIRSDPWITHCGMADCRCDDAVAGGPLIQQTRITARRGLADQFPENTLLAFRKALEHGADRLELDVHLSLDRQLVVHHRYALGDTDDGEGLIYQHDSSYLRALDAGGWMSPQFAGTRIQLLEEVFAAIGDQTEYELDLKGFELDFLQSVLDLVRTHGLLHRVELTSAFPFLLAHARRLEPQVRIGMFAHYLLADWMPLDLQHTIVRENARLGDIDVVHCPLALLTAEFIEACHDDGRLVHAAICNTHSDLEHAFALGVDQLSTDHVDLAVSLRG